MQSNLWAKIIAIGGLLLFGTINSNISKLVYEIDAKSLYGEHRLFRKPWAMTTIMFLGMTISLVLVFVENQRKKLARKKRALQDQQQPFLVDEQQNNNSKEHDKKMLKDLVLISAPAVFDLLATGLMNAGLLSVTASVYQMLRGSEMLFAALFSVIFLRRTLNKYNLIGLAFCMVGIASVGLSSIMSEQGGAVGQVSVSEILQGMGLIILSQCIQAGQVTFEDFILTDMEVSTSTIVGFEGLWGLILMLAVILPITFFLPGEEGNGLHENIFDTLYMIRHSKQLFIILVASLFTNFFYNIVGMLVIGQMGAVFRTVLETMRTLLVWIVGLILFYTSDGRYGEEWTNYSFIQLLGFALLVGGTFVYAWGNKKSAMEEEYGYPQEPQLQIPTSEQIENQIEQVAVPQTNQGAIQVDVPRQSHDTPARITHSIISGSYQGNSYHGHSLRNRNMGHHQDF